MEVTKIFKRYSKIVGSKDLADTQDAYDPTKYTFTMPAVNVLAMVQFTIHDHMFTYTADGYCHRAGQGQLHGFREGDLQDKAWQGVEAHRQERETEDHDRDLEKVAGSICCCS